MTWKRVAAKPPIIRLESGTSGNVWSSFFKNVISHILKPCQKNCVADKHRGTWTHRGSISMSRSPLFRWAEHNTCHCPFYISQLSKVYKDIFTKPKLRETPTENEVTLLNSFCIQTAVLYLFYTPSQIQQFLNQSCTRVLAHAHIHIYCLSSSASRERPDLYSVCSDISPT